MVDHRGIVYEPNAKGVAQRVMCPLVSTWITAAECLENQSVKAEAIPEHFKQKSEWVSICGKCPFRDY